MPRNFGWIDGAAPDVNQVVLRHVINTAFDAHVTSTLTIPLVFSGQPGYLLVAISLKDSLAETFVDGPPGWNSVAMTALSAGVVSGLYLYGLVNPAQGARNLEIVFSDANLKAGNVCAMMFSNVSQAAPVGTVFTATGTSTGPTVNVTGTEVGGLVVDTTIAGLGVTAPTYAAGAGQTEQADVTCGQVLDATRHRMGVSTEPGTGGTVTMSSTLGASDTWGIIAVELKHA